MIYQKLNDLLEMPNPCLLQKTSIQDLLLICSLIPTIGAFKIDETDASDIGYGGILKQRISLESPEQIVRFYSGIWNNAQLNYSTI